MKLYGGEEGIEGAYAQSEEAIKAIAYELGCMPGEVAVQFTEVDENDLVIVVTGETVDSEEDLHRRRMGLEKPKGV